jgi:hypothetical protein
MKRFIFFSVSLFTLFSGKCFSGTGNSEGSDSTSKKIFFSVDYRNSFITSTDAHVIGFRSGVELNKKFRLGIGYHFLNSEIIKQISFDNVIANSQVRLRYGSVSAEYVLLSGTLWQLSMPVILGFGQSAYIAPVKYGIKEKHFTMFVEPAITFQYNLIPFIGIGTGIGYRFMPAGDTRLRSTFETPLYDFRIKILMDDVIEALFP